MPSSAVVMTVACRTAPPASVSRVPLPVYSITGSADTTGGGEEVLEPLLLDDDPEEPIESEEPDDPEEPLSDVSSFVTARSRAVEVPAA